MRAGTAGIVLAGTLAAAAVMGPETLALEPPEALDGRPSVILAPSRPDLDVGVPRSPGFVSEYLAPNLTSRLARVGAVVGSPVFLQDDRAYSSWRAGVTEQARHDAERAARSAVKRFVLERLEIDRLSLPLFGSKRGASGVSSSPAPAARHGQLRFGFSGLVPTMEANLATGNGRVVIGVRGNGGLDLEYRGARPGAFTMGAGFRPLRDAYWFSLRREF